MSETVIITGASGKIGQACAVSAAKNGYNVAVCFNKNELAANDICKHINEQKGMQEGCAKPFFVNVKNEKSIVQMFENVEADFGNIYAVVNNAGIACYKLITQTTIEDWNDVFDTNVKGAYLCSKYAINYMLSKKQGSIINISSMWGQVGASCEVAYSAAKAALIGFTKALAKELGPSNINVNCIAPGVIETNMLDEFTQEEKIQLIQQTPLGRLGTPEDVANMVEFLLKDNSRFITGQVFGVNGGFVI